MMYSLLTGIARVALRWYYRDVSVRGLQRVPREGPLLVVVNHPNALVDVLVVGSLLPRQLMITAKSTLFVNPLAGWMLRKLGVLPLRRASDVAKLAADVPRDPGRNEDTFRAVLDELARGGAVLIFPEGKSHDDPQLAPLRTGAARMALQARDEGRAPDLAILPVGLTFERKEAVRSRVHAEVGAPLVISRWRAAGAQQDSPAALTAEIMQRLQAVTLNYASMSEALREHDLARFLAAVADEHSTIERVRPLDEEVSLARRMAESRALVGGAPPAVASRGPALLERVDALDAELARRRLSPSDIEISTGGVPGARFALREGVLLLLGAPAVLWGRVHHWIPFRLAMRLGRSGDSSRDQPAMRAMVGGLVIILGWYVLLGALAWRWLGPLAAALYVLSLPIAADLDLRLSERIRRMRQRVRAYLAFRKDPELQQRLAGELAWIRQEALSLEAELRRSMPAQPGQAEDAVFGGR